MPSSNWTRTGTLENVRFTHKTANAEVRSRGSRWQVVVDRVELKGPTGGRRLFLTSGKAMAIAEGLVAPAVEARKQVTKEAGAKAKEIVTALTKTARDGKSRAKRPAKKPAKVAKAKVPPKSGSVFEVAEEHGTEDKLRSLVEVATARGLHPRLCRASVMLTPQMNKGRMVVTVWAKPVKAGIKAYVHIDAFLEFFPYLDRDALLSQLGADGWATLDDDGFNALLEGIRGLALMQRAA